MDKKRSIKTLTEISEYTHKKGNTKLCCLKTIREPQIQLGHMLPQSHYVCLDGSHDFRNRPSI